MKFSAFAIVLIFAACSLAEDVASLPAPWPPPKDPAASSFAKMPCSSYASYKVKDVVVNPAWGEIHPDDFGTRDVRFDYSGVRTLNQVAQPGVHPRILCTPADLADIRRRLKETRCGQEAWKNLLCYTNLMKGTYDPKAAYAQCPNPIENNGVLSRVPLTRMNVGSKNSIAVARYRGLIRGETAQEAGGLWPVFSLEAFRCWIDNDSAAAHDLAAAVTTALKIDQAKRKTTRKDKNAPLDQPIAGIHLAWAYDFLFNWLSPGQRKAIHDELANGTWNHDNYGAFNTAENSRSNWATFSYWLIESLAIEGESGFNDLKVRGMYRGWRNLLTYGWFESGATYEGEAKNQLGLEGILVFAMRQKAYGFDDLAAHPFARAYARNFIPKSLIPTRDGFVRYDLLGGCHGKPLPSDMLGLKFLMPDNKIIDFAYRSAVGENYENVPNRCEAGVFDPTIGGGYGNPLMFFLIYACDFEKNKADPAQFNVGNTFFCGDRALMMTRSGWDKDAMMLNLHVRQANGGHPFADRNSIMVAGAGRVWSPIYGWGENGWKNIHNSEVVIDDHPQADHIPGRMVDFVDNPQATFAVGDASYAWDWNWRFDDPYSKGIYTMEDVKNHAIRVDKGWELEPHSVNDFSYLKRDYAYLNTPLSEQPDWLKKAGAISPIEREVNYPVQRAFRTAGLIRGVNPYALVIDDIQKDDAAHDYVWYMTLEYDVQIASLARHGEHEMDLVLTGKDPAQTGEPGKEPLPATLAGGNIPEDQPALLVRFLNYNTEAGAPISTETKEPTILEDAPPPDFKGHHVNRVRRLAVPVHAVSPDFKVLLYAYRRGAALPATQWNGSSLSVAWKDQQDRVEFSAADTGKTNVRVSRGESELASVSKPIPPLDSKQ